MADISSLLKSEITRLAKKAVKQHLGPLSSQSSAHRRHIAALRRQVADLERQVAQLRRASTVAQKPAAESSEDATVDVRFRPKGLKPLRERLGLSAADFGALLGVSGKSVYQWEQGKVRPRKQQLIAIAEIRKIGKREAKLRLALNKQQESAVRKRSQRLRKRAA